MQNVEGPGISDNLTSDKQSLREAAAKGSAVTLISQSLRMVLQVVSVVILARLISPGDFGLLAMTLAVCSVASIFLDSGFSMAALRAEDLTQQQHSNLFWINALAGLLLAGIVFILAEPIAWFFDQPDLVFITRWISLTYLLGGLTAQHRIKLNREMKFRALAISDVMAPLFGLFFAVVLALYGLSISALIAQQLVASTVLLIFSLTATKWIPNLPRRTEGMRSLLSFGISFAATRVLSYVTQNIDSIAIGKMWDTASLGLYDRAYRVSITPITQISFPMTRIAMPVLTRVLKDSKKFIEALREAQLIGTYLSVTLLLILGSLSEIAVGLMFGTDWIAAAPILTILCIGGVFRTLQQVANWVLIAKGLSGSLLRLNLFMQPVVVVLTIAGVFWGPVGVGAGAALGYFLYWIISVLWAGRAANLNLFALIWHPVRVIIVFSMPAALIAFFLTQWFHNSLWAQLAVGMVGILAWFAISSLLFGFIRRDLKIILSFVRLAVARR